MIGHPRKFDTVLTSPQPARNVHQQPAGAGKCLERWRMDIQQLFRGNRMPRQLTGQVGTGWWLNRIDGNIVLRIRSREAVADKPESDGYLGRYVAVDFCPAELAGRSSRGYVG